MLVSDVYRCCNSNEWNEIQLVKRHASDVFIREDLLFALNIRLVEADCLLYFAVTRQDDERVRDQRDDRAWRGLVDRPSIAKDKLHICPVVVYLSEVLLARRSVAIHF